MSAKAPVLAQVEGQIRSNDLSASVTHEACCIELSHEGINDRHASLAILPSGDQLRFNLPGKAIVSFRADTLLPEHSCLVCLTIEAEELAPTQLEVKVISGLIFHYLLFEREDVIVELANGKSAVG